MIICWIGVKTGAEGWTRHSYLPAPLPDATASRCCPSRISWQSEKAMRRTTTGEPVPFTPASCLSDTVPSNISQNFLAFWTISFRSENFMAIREGNASNYDRRARPVHSRLVLVRYRAIKHLAEFSGLLDNFFRVLCVKVVAVKLDAPGRILVVRGRLEPLG